MFSCTPLEAMAQPLPLLVEIMETRAFVETWQRIEDARADETVRAPSGPITDLIMEFRAADVAASAWKARRKPVSE